MADGRLVAATAAATTVVVVTAAAAAAAVAAATAAAAVLWNVVGSSITHEHYFAFIFHTFSCKAVIKVHSHGIVVDMQHNSLCRLPRRSHHCQHFSLLHHVAHEVAISVIEKVACQFHHKVFLPLSECLFGRQREIKCITLGKPLQLT